VEALPPRTLRILVRTPLFPLVVSDHTENQSLENLEYTLVVVRLIDNLHIELDICTGEHTLPPVVLNRELPSPKLGHHSTDGHRYPGELQRDYLISRGVRQGR